MKSSAHRLLSSSRLVKSDVTCVAPFLPSSLHEARNTGDAFHYQHQNDRSDDDDTASRSRAASSPLRLAASASMLWSPMRWGFARHIRPGYSVAAAKDAASNRMSKASSVLMMRNIYKLFLPVWRALELSHGLRTGGLSFCANYIAARLVANQTVADIAIAVTLDGSGGRAYSRRYWRRWYKSASQKIDQADNCRPRPYHAS